VVVEGRYPDGSGYLRYDGQGKCPFDWDARLRTRRRVVYWLFLGVLVAVVVAVAVL
jgi:hypothetical protein